MLYLTLDEVLVIHHRVMRQSGGIGGILNLGALESAIAQPRMTFGGKELYPTLVEKVTALGFSLVQNHPFVDGNKRTGHAAMEMFLARNGYTIDATIEEQVRIMVQVASGESGRDELSDWLRSHTGPREGLR